LRSGKKFTRGDVFTVTSVERNGNDIKVEIRLTDYAHYLFTRNMAFDEKLSCRVIYAAAMIKTNDDKVLIGVMGEHTSSPGRMQFSGGGIDLNDLRGNEIDFLSSVTKEMAEEVGLEVSNAYASRIYPKYFKSGGAHNSLAITYMIDLNISAREVEEIFQANNQKIMSENKNPEFDSLLFVGHDPEKISELEKLGPDQINDYIATLLKMELY